METQGKSKLAWVQNDLFCNCGYNLFAQPVQVDERLGIPVSRCPECGKFHAMTTTFASLSTWRSRQEQAIIISITLFVMIAMALMTLGLWGLEMGYLEFDFEIKHYYDRQQYYTNVYQTNLPPSSGLPPGSVPAPVYYYQRTPSSGDQFVLVWGMHLYRLGCMLGGLIYVSVAMTFFWHWKKKLYFLLALVPVLAAAMTLWVIHMEDPNQTMQFRDGYGNLRICLGALFEIIGMVIAIWVGRKTIRGLIRTFVPPKWRTPFKHLWLVDGVRMPWMDFKESTQEILRAEPEKRVVDGPPVSKVPESRKGLETATDVIARMMAGETKPQQQSSTENSNP